MLIAGHNTCWRKLKRPKNNDWFSTKKFEINCSAKPASITQKEISTLFLKRLEILFFFSSKVLNTTHCIKKWKKRTCFPPEAVMNEWKGRGGMSGNVTSGLWRNRNGWDTAARLRKKIESTFTRLMWYFMLKMVFSNLSIHVITIYSSSTWSQKINSIRRIGHKNGKFLPKSWTNISMVRMGVPKRGSKI